MTETTDMIGIVRGGSIALVRRPRQGSVPPRVARAAQRTAGDPAGRWTPPILWLVLAAIAAVYVPAWASVGFLALAIVGGWRWARWWPHRLD